MLFVFAYESPAFALLFALPPNKTPEGQTTVKIFLLKIIARSRSPHSYLSRKGVTLLYLLQNVFYLAGICEELLRFAFGVVFLELNFHEEAVRTEFRFHVFDEIN